MGENWKEPLTQDQTDRLVRAEEGFTISAATEAAIRYALDRLEYLESARVDLMRERAALRAENATLRARGAKRAEPGS